jgi:hypothetical protein
LLHVVLLNGCYELLNEAEAEADNVDRNKDLFLNPVLSCLQYILLEELHRKVAPPFDLSGLMSARLLSLNTFSSLRLIAIAGLLRMLPSSYLQTELPIWIESVLHDPNHPFRKGVFDKYWKCCSSVWLPLLYKPPEQRIFPESFFVASLQFVEHMPRYRADLEATLPSESQMLSFFHSLRHIRFWALMDLVGPKHLLRDQITIEINSKMIESVINEIMESAFWKDV